jgi:Putative zinc ribbon domain
MPLSRDPERGGTNADGSKSALFCSLCFANGKFRHPEFTAAQMQEFCVEQLRKKGMPRVMAWFFTRGIPRLQRWRAS